MAKCILRTEKLKTFGNIGGSTSHNFRERDTPNADSALTRNNTTKGAKSTIEVRSAVQLRLATVKVRKNAVLMLEYFIGASPEFFDEIATKDCQEKYFDDAEAWLIQKHGLVNVITLTRHYDEKTPHMAGFIVPIDPRGKLNCSYFTDGRKVLSDMQTDYWEKVGSKSNLERGEEGSRAKHITIKNFYRVVNAPTAKHITKIPEVPEPTIVEICKMRAGIKNSYSTAKKAQMVALKKQLEEYKNLLKTAQAKAALFDLNKANMASRDKILENKRTNVVHLRALSVQGVLRQIGCSLDPKAKNDWRTPVGRLTVQSDGVNFFAHDIDRVGSGAIDIIQCINDIDYNGALQYLISIFGFDQIMSDLSLNLKKQVEKIMEQPTPLYAPPLPVPANWPLVRKYLTQTRCLSDEIVDRLHMVGTLYADRVCNCVFLLNNKRGVELCGTREYPFSGFLGEITFYGIRGAADQNRVAFVSSAIDALSLYQLKKETIRSIWSISGSSEEVCRSVAEAYRAKGYEIVAAQDNDVAGDLQAEYLGQPTTRMRPQEKHWNDDLVVLIKNESKIVHEPLPEATERNRQGCAP